MHDLESFDKIYDLLTISHQRIDGEENEADTVDDSDDEGMPDLIPLE